MHRNVIRFVALNLVLRLILARMNLVAFELDLGGDFPYDRAAHSAGLRIPTDMFSHFEALHRRHRIYPFAQPNHIPVISQTYGR